MIFETLNDIITDHLDRSEYPEAQRGLFYFGCAAKLVFEKGLPNEFKQYMGLNAGSTTKEGLMKAMTMVFKKGFVETSDDFAEKLLSLGMISINRTMETWELKGHDVLHFFIAGHSFMTGLRYLIYDVVGTAEAANIMGPGWTAQKVATYSDREAFAPVFKKLSCGKLFLRHEVEKYRNERRDE
ncbi:hypothetical protein [Paenibacillus tyrfis]|uniref:hypothetical protein n=1 Tax=Paenibacillus tyrfis TaxID=1501230 RepID=UPI000B5954E1|nr:hypothetical protein [Paenibacillus tyrfis]